MKTIIYTCILISNFICFFCNVCFSQVGNIDTSHILLSSPLYDFKNPQFDKTGTSINYSIRDCILAYEKWSSVTNSIIAVRFMKYNSLGTETELTDNTSLNTNPAVAYNIEQSTPSENNPGAVVFQTNRNGNWDIYFSHYDGAAWSKPSAVASSSEDETNPSIVSYLRNDVLNFVISYKKGNDIYLKSFFNGNWKDERNITMNDSLNCSSPSLTESALFQSNFYLAYQRTIAVLANSIIIQSFNINSEGSFNLGSGTVISQPNSQDNIRFSNGINHTMLNYDYENSGTKHFYSALIQFGTNYTLADQTSNFTGDNFGGTGSSHGDITSDYLSGYSLYSWIRKIEDSTQIVISNYLISKFYVGDVDAQTFVNSSSKLVFGAPFTLYRIRILWEKRINGKTAIIESFRDSYLTSESSNTSAVADKFSLSQNYPNPFNPKTIINYSIPSYVKDQRSNVKLIVYNNLGKEIATLVNEKQNAGSYAVDFDGERLPSGVYFYKLEAGDFVETKRMILLK